jgi:hypothetical protein
MMFDKILDLLMPSRVVARQVRERGFREIHVPDPGAFRRDPSTIIFPDGLEPIVGDEHYCDADGHYLYSIGMPRV